MNRRKPFQNKRLIFTPNVREYSRMCKIVLNVEDAPIATLAKELDAVVIKKGEEDIISDGHEGK